ncbi:MAG: lytic transglycosylase domain-containing protein [Spirochaetales bacterium]|nr:lytic transglycosylase domain-containing protein [Spirochaetales bacterium]
MRTRITALLIIAITIFTPSCVGSSIHGLDEAEWIHILAGDEPLPIRADKHIDFEALMTLGPGSLLFIGMSAQSRGDEELARILLTEAAQRESGRYRERAVALLSEALVAANDGDGLIQLCASGGGATLSPYRRAYLSAIGLSLTNDHAGAALALEALRAEFPAEAARDEVPLAALSLRSAFLGGRGRWTDDFAALVRAPGSLATYQALADAVALITRSGADASSGAIKAVGVGTFQLAEARALAGVREYGPAVVAFRRYALDVENHVAVTARVLPTTNIPTTATPDASGSEVAAETLPLAPKDWIRLLRTVPPAVASDAARCLMAASRDEGAEVFSYIVKLGDWSVYPSREYFERFWHGRFLREAENWGDAESAFAKAASVAATPPERDAASWYAVDSTLRRSTAKAVVALGSALSSSRNPAYFADLIEQISREALVARDGATLVALDAATRGRTTSRDAARLAYLCARATQTGIITGTQLRAAFGAAYKDVGEYVESRLVAAWDQRSDGWYRLAAAYRLGEPLFYALDSGVPGPELIEQKIPVPMAQTGEAEEKTTAADPHVVGADEYALQLARFGLGARVREELGAEFNTLAWDTIRAVATTLRDQGRYSQSYRLIATLFWKAAFTPAREDAELYWPRPYRDVFSSASLATRLDEFLLYGLARSESAFDPNVVSRSGAVGLTQLMPATAEEMAGRLKLDDWSIRDPGDNVMIGASYLARIMAGVDGRVLPAVFSYNGGPTRFRRWEAEYGALPLDLLLEALSYAETRQYGRNVATAALSYAALYGDLDLRSYFAWLIGEAPHP